MPRASLLPAGEAAWYYAPDLALYRDVPTHMATYQANGTCGAGIVALAGWVYDHG